MSSFFYHARSSKRYGMNVEIEYLDCIIEFKKGSAVCWVHFKMLNYFTVFNETNGKYSAGAELKFWTSQSSL